MATIKRLLLGVCTIIFGSCLFKPVQNQSYSPISVDLSMCPTARMTTEVDPGSNTLGFDWFLNDGSKTINLGIVSLNGEGSIGVQKTTNDYTDRYELVNEPSTLDPDNAPFNSSVVFTYLNSVEEFVFIVDVNGRNVRSGAVSGLVCRFPKDPNCMSNCLNEILCDNSITKQCADSKSVLQECPVDGSTAEYNPCEADYSAFIIAGVVVAIVVVIVICSIYAFRIYSARTRTVDHSQKLARDEEVPGDNHDQ